MKMTFLYLPLFALLFVGCGDSAEVGTTCEKFLQARMLLREDQTNLLEEVASKDMFELMMLHREYEKIVGAPISRPDLRLRTKSVTMDDAGCGICKMSGELHYQIHVCKEDEKWVVVAENDHFPSEEDKSKARKKIEDQMEFLAKKPMVDSVLMKVYEFHVGVNKYFTEQNESLMKPHADEATFQLVQDLYDLALTRTGETQLKESLAKQKFITMDVEMVDGLVHSVFYRDDVEVNLRQVNGEYVVVGLNGVESTNLSHEAMEEDYPRLLKALKLVRAKDLEDGLIN